MSQGPAPMLSYATPGYEDSGPRRLMWCLVGILGYQAANGLASLVSMGVVVLAASVSVGGQALGVVSVAAQYLTLVVVVLPLAAWCMRGRQPSGGALIVIALLAFIFSCGAGISRLVFWPMVSRMVGVQSLGTMSMVQGFASIGWTVALPVLLLVLILWLRGRSGQLS